ncbi:MAG: DUF4252 domain-containing protein [Bacteroidales bacterium]|nr:DUF4252 domain-containing protein [Bacteroidales bacterium]
MKRMVLTLLIAALAVAIYGQRNSLEDFFDSYADRDGYTSVTISGDLFGLLGRFDDDHEMDGADRKITSVRIVSRKKENGFSGTGFLSEIRGVIRRGRYEELITVKDPETDLSIMVKSNGNIIREILVVASGENEAVIQVCGNLTREDVERLSENHTDGLALLEMLESSGKW